MLEATRGQRPLTSAVAGALLAAILAGCSGSAANVAAPQALKPSNNANTEQFQLLTGDAALENGEIRIRLIDKTTTGLRTQALPSTFANANIRLSQANLVTPAPTSSPVLTSDRVVTIPRTSFVGNNNNPCNPGAATPDTACIAGSSTTTVFTKLRPVSYLLQISLTDSSTPPQSLAVQSINITVVGGTTTNMVVTLQTTNTGTNTITITSQGTESYPAGASPSPGNLNNATASNTLPATSPARAAGALVVVVGDSVNTVSPMVSGNATVNTQNTTNVVNTTSPVNGSPSFTTSPNYQVSRIVASIKAGNVTSVSTDTPDSSEKIVAIWYADANEARTGITWTGFYGSANDNAGIVSNVSTTGLTSGVNLVTGLLSNVTYTVPGAADVSSLTLVTSETTSTDVNATMIYRFYDNTFEHRYIGANVSQKLVIDDPAGIQVTVN